MLRPQCRPLGLVSAPSGVPDHRLRLRSPFSLTAIMMVGARVRDGGNPPSDVQRACLSHAQRIAVGTLFNPVSRVEAVQAMSKLASEWALTAALLAAFSDSGWLSGGHAVRMAIDMGINKSFIQLLRSGMGKGKTRAELEDERHLVVHSRTWFCVRLTLSILTDNSCTWWNTKWRMAWADRRFSARTRQYTTAAGCWSILCPLHPMQDWYPPSS